MVAVYLTEFIFDHPDHFLQPIRLFPSLGLHIGNEIKETRSIESFIQMIGLLL